MCSSDNHYPTVPETTTPQRQVGFKPFAHYEHVDVTCSLERSSEKFVKISLKGEGKPAKTQRCLHHCKYANIIKSRLCTMMTMITTL